MIAVLNRAGSSELYCYISLVWSTRIHIRMESPVIVEENVDDCILRNSDAKAQNFKNKKSDWSTPYILSSLRPAM